MLRSIKQLYGNKLGTADGEVGHIRDFYFDDEHWAIRYVIVETGSWLEGRLVLISPHAFGTFFKDGDDVLVNLSREQIEKSPSIDLHKPVSRQFEEEYYRYYGWPAYWSGAGMWGISGFPAIRPPDLIPINEGVLSNSRDNSNDPHLRSTRGLVGYHLQTHDEVIGHVTDFVMDDKSWGIRSLIIETGHWFDGKEIRISPQEVEAISYENSKVLVSLTKEAIQNEPEYQGPVLGNTYPTMGGILL